jgi:glycosyltransferase involved in cell wall biosynthesis
MLFPDSPSVSVLLPFRNAGNSLADAIQSILRQTFTDYELLLVDNASTDDSTIIARELARQDHRIRLLREERPGIVPALNTGLAHARAACIARMDADDIAYPERLAMQYRYLQNHSEIGLLASKVDFAGSVRAEGLRAYVDWSNQLISYAQLSMNRFVDAPLVHPSVMFRKQEADRHGGYREGDFPEDFELWLRWMEAGVGFAKIDTPLLQWQDHPQRLTRRSERYRPEAFYSTKAIYLNQWLRHHNPFYPEVVIWGGGRKSRQRAALLEAEGSRVTAYIDIKAQKTTTRPCIHYQEIAAPGTYFVVSYVGNQGQREKIRDFLLSRGYQEGIHFLLAA